MSFAQHQYTSPQPLILQHCSSTYSTHFILSKPTIYPATTLSKKLKLNNGLAYCFINNYSSSNDSTTKRQSTSSTDLTTLVKLDTKAHTPSTEQSLTSMNNLVAHAACGARNLQVENTYKPSLLSDLKLFLSTLSTSQIQPSSTEGSSATPSTLDFIQTYDPESFMAHLPTNADPTRKIITKIDETESEEPSFNHKFHTSNQASSELHSSINFPCGNPKQFTCILDQSLNITMKSNPNDPMHLTMKKRLKNLFFLYLNGDCRGINDCFSLQEDTLFQAAISNRYVSYKYKSKHINFDLHANKQAANDQFRAPSNHSQPEKQQLASNTNLPQQPSAIIYNKSKYVMQFLLSLLEPDHLSYLTIPEGFQRQIQGIVSRLRETSKKNKLSQSQFYNHAHFDCLFMQIHEANAKEITEKNNDLRVMHERVFDMPEIRSAFNLHTVNMYKHLLSEIIQLQVNVIVEDIIPQLSIHSLSFKSASKLRYFQRICDSLVKLDQGQAVAKF